MSSFDNELKTSLPSMFDVFGSEIFVKGIKVAGIFELKEVEEEVGYIQIPTIEVNRENLKWFSKGDSVYVDKELYKVRNIPETDEILAMVVLKRA